MKNLILSLMLAASSGISPLAIYAESPIAFAESAAPRASYNMSKYFSLPNGITGTAYVVVDGDSGKISSCGLSFISAGAAKAVFISGQHTYKAVVRVSGTVNDVTSYVDLTFTSGGPI